MSNLKSSLVKFKPSSALLPAGSLPSEGTGPQTGLNIQTPYQKCLMGSNNCSYPSVRLSSFQQCDTINLVYPVTNARPIFAEWYSRNHICVQSCSGQNKVPAPFLYFLFNYTILSPLFHTVILSCSCLALFSSLVSFKKFNEGCCLQLKDWCKYQRVQICTLTLNILILTVRTESYSLSTASRAAMTLLTIVSSYTSHLFTPPHIHHEKVFWDTVKGCTKLTFPPHFAVPVALLTGNYSPVAPPAPHKPTVALCFSLAKF